MVELSYLILFLLFFSIAKKQKITVNRIVDSCNAVFKSYRPVQVLKIPVVISGGCGKASHFTDCFNTTDVQGIAAGNFFSNRDQNVYQTRAQLINSNVPLRKVK